MDQRFDEPVSLMLGISMTCTVDRPAKAADILLRQWPTEGGEKHRAARAAVLKAMENPSDPHLAALSREAFEDAAREADILMERQPFGVAGSNLIPKYKTRRKAGQVATV
ncbi:hypothetical protein ASD50_21645 [Mesorhizobium sp. Root552]|uniref:DUF982 domain-containing protein n=1 Tax=Mesorhizobium sp. Root552 TaxID=1736555 RepID=UPI0006F999FD|nr:DUF982 domain-containing protein [Mesorhizobium sp. Root552]KQZ20794.1 hypothetical protein ASD50_21645 [Mesorhizobium sp. Root552]